MLILALDLAQIKSLEFRVRKLKEQIETISEFIVVVNNNKTGLPLSLSW